MLIGELVMKGRGLLTLSYRNRCSARGGSQAETESYDHDALSLEDLYEYTPPAQQMQDMGSFFPQPSSPPLSPALPPLELRHVDLLDRKGLTPELEADSEKRLFNERLVELAQDKVPAGEIESALTPGEGISPPDHEGAVEETEPVYDRQEWGLESFEPEPEIQLLDDDPYAFEDDDASDDVQWLEDLSSLGQVSDLDTGAGPRRSRRTSQRNLRYERSRQLAEAYLAKAGLLDEKNVDLLSEVVYHKRWSATQYRVNKLVRAGLSIEQVHAAFELRRIWGLLMDSNPVPDYWRRSLSWDCATVLLHSIGDWEVEVDGWHAHFLQSELECWLSKMGRGRWDGHFIDYLLNFRLPDAAHVEQVVDPALCIGLDGSHNPLFDRQWMEDWDDMGPPVERQTYLNVLLGREGRDLY